MNNKSKGEIEIKFTAEQIAKMNAAKSAEELIALAKAEGIEATEEQIRAQLATMHDNGELADDELDNVSGGCGSGSATEWYVVVPGETLGNIAHRYHTTVQALFNANKDMLAERGIYTVQEFNAKLFEIKIIRIGY